MSLLLLLLLLLSLFLFLLFLLLLLLLVVVVVVVVVVVGGGDGGVGGYGDHLMYISSSTKLHVLLQSSTYFIICQTRSSDPISLFSCNIHTSRFIPGRLQCIK